MKRFPLILALCLIAHTAALGANSITIDTPTSPVAIGQIVDISITGIEPSMYGQALKSLGHWPPAKYFKPIRGWGDEKISVAFMATKPGEYEIRVSSARSEDGELIIEHANAVIVVGGSPQPDPNPTPDPPVPIPGERSFVVICETDQRTSPEADMIGRLTSYFYLQEDRYFDRIEDKDLKDGLESKRQGKLIPPEWFKPYKKAWTESGKSLPVLVVIAQTPDGKVSSVVAVESLTGKTGAEAVELVKKWGG